MTGSSRWVFLPKVTQREQFRHRIVLVWLHSQP